MREARLHRSVGVGAANRGTRARKTGGRSGVADAGSIAQVQTEHVGAAFREGDAVAREVLTETAFLLTVWLGNIVDLLEPDVIVVGGGVAELMSSFFAAISDDLPRWCLNQRAGETPLVLARYGADAGIAGAAALCR